MDAFLNGETYDMSGQPKEMQDYAKTANIILGETLYSDSWLEI